MAIPASTRRRQPVAQRTVWVFLGFMASLVVVVKRFQSVPAPTSDHGTVRLQTPPSSTHINKMQPADNDDVYGGLCRRAARRLQELNVQVIALDFDLTIIDIHTGGKWEGDAATLVSHVRPQVQCLMQQARKLGLQVAVASFSAQEGLLRETMRLAMMDSDGTSMIVVGGRNISEKTGKRQQLEKILDAMASKNAPRSTDRSPAKANTLLIDDDPGNIRMARKDGYLSFWFDPDHADSFLSLILEWSP